MWIVLDGGVASQHHDEPGTMGVPLGSARAELPRELDLLVETWDFAEGCIVALPEGRDNRIDQGHRADHGALSIRMAHIQKAVEAQLILAGIDLPLSLVAAEAAATDVAIKDLAAAIVERQAQTNTIELARRIAKKSD
ncbi:MAG: hypothetical protein V4610_01790 [Pseudomonadota bacterium]|jgi:hypothetical protein